MKYRNKIGLALSVFIAAIVASGCDDKKTCTQPVETLEAPIASIEGPHRMAVNTKYALTVGVINNTAYCVDGAEAGMEVVGPNNIVLTGSLRHKGGRFDRSTAGCHCAEDSIVYTVVYFTPLFKGSYYFRSKGNVNTGNVVSPGSVYLPVVVE
jgi:hypothetical protein